MSTADKLRAVLTFVLIVGIWLAVYASWRAENKADRDFARRHLIVPPRFDGRVADRDRRDPSPTPRRKVAS